MLYNLHSNNDENLFTEAGLLCEVCIILPSILHLTAKPVQNEVVSKFTAGEWQRNDVKCTVAQQFRIVENRPKLFSRLAQCPPKSSQGRFIFESASVFCASLDCIDENLTLFIVFRRFPLDSQIFSIATEGMSWLQPTTDYTPYSHVSTWFKF